MHQDSNERSTNKGGRPRTGTLEWKGGTWQARITVTVEGESVRRWVRLETDNKVVARRKLARLLEQPTTDLTTMQELATRAETYSELAARVTKQRASEGIADVDAEDGRENTWILSEIGHLEVGKIRPEHIAGIYENARVANKSLSTLRHLRGILRSKAASRLLRFHSDYTNYCADWALCHLVRVSVARFGRMMGFEIPTHHASSLR